MNLSDYYVVLALSVFLSLLVEEFIGVSAGGLIVPGVLAMNYNSPDIIIYIYFLSFVVFLIVFQIFSRHMILYGKRKFAMSVLVSLLFKLIFDQFFPIMPLATVGFRGVGTITPALLANTYDRQGVLYTIPSSILVTLIIIAIMRFIFAF